MKYRVRNLKACLKTRQGAACLIHEEAMIYVASSRVFDCNTVGVGIERAILNPRVVCKHGAFISTEMTSVGSNSLRSSARRQASALEIQPIQGHFIREQPERI